MSIVLQDTFAGRTLASGWGTASDGNVWSQTQGSAGNLSVSSNEGNINGSVWCQMELGTTTLADAEILVRYASNMTNGGGPILRYSASTTFIHFRTGTGQAGLGGQGVWFRVQISGNNFDYGAVAFSFTNGTFYWFRARVQGSNLFLKVWQDGTSEPAGWTTTATMSGGGIISAAGKAGIMANDSGAHVDSLTVDDLSGSTVQGAIDFGHNHALALSPGSLIAGALDFGHEQGLAFSPGGLIAGALDLGQQQQLSLAPVMQASDSLALSHQSSLSLTPGALIQGKLDLVHSHGLALSGIVPGGALSSASASVVQGGVGASVAQGGVGATVVQN